ncbi:MAG: hypothetical protein NT116_01910 [Candidatus Parcubacteria bacterium]|nr:hypothetical protein [Candidatus Parcubacteria bacterium]
MHKITEKITLSDVLSIKGAEKILEKYNFPCLSCPFAKVEMEKLKLGEICKNYNIDVDGLISELKKLYNKNNNK